MEQNIGIRQGAVIDLTLVASGASENRRRELEAGMDSFVIVFRFVAGK
jgi:hypothetical protein